jgi:predicted Zn-dependent peptidase
VVKRECAGGGAVRHDDDYRPLDAMLAEIDRVTPDEVAAVAGEFFTPERQTVVRLGPQNSVNGKR